jgi:hypothetical protein
MYVLTIYSRRYTNLRSHDNTIFFHKFRKLISFVKFLISWLESIHKMHENLYFVNNNEYTEYIELYTSIYA